MKQTTFAAVLLLLITFSSCKKEETSAPVNSNSPSKTELLTAKSWIEIGAIEDGENVFADLDACSKDDLYIFKPNGVYVYDEGATKCDPNDEQVIHTDAWKLINNDTQLAYDGNIENIITLTADKLVLEFEDGGKKYTYTYTTN